VSASLVVAALSCVLRVHFTLYARLTTAGRAHHVRAAAAAAAGRGADAAAAAAAGAAAGADFDRVAHTRQQQCLRALCDVLAGPGLDALVSSVRRVVAVAASTPPYRVTHPRTRAPTTVSAAHFGGLLDAVLAGMDDAPTSPYAPSPVLDALLPLRLPPPAGGPAAGSPGRAAGGGHGAGGGAGTPAPARAGGMTAGALIDLATGRAPLSSAPSVSPVPWSPQLLVGLTLDAARSPPAQAAVRAAIAAVAAAAMHPAAQLHALGGDTGGADAGEHALGAVVMALRTATDAVLAAPGDGGGGGGGGGGARGGRAGPPPLPTDPCTVATAVAPLTDLCYQLMWHAKLM
jgi:hypothetical protein